MIQSASMPVLRLLIADDHPALREGLAALIKQQGDMTVVAMATDGQDAIEQYRQHQPDVALMDLQMPKLEGAAAAAAIRAEFPSARILILTTYYGNEDIYRALSAGALGYLLKDAPSQDLFEAIRMVGAGHRYITSEIAGILTERIQHPELSDREIEVLQLMAQGKSNKEISKVLSVVEGTVKFHVRRILEKLGVRDRTQAVTAALKRGLVRLW